MNPWLEENQSVIESWETLQDEKCCENERAYLLNDIGPLLYVFNNITEDMLFELLA